MTNQENITYTARLEAALYDTTMMLAQLARGEATKEEAWRLVGEIEEAFGMVGQGDDLDWRQK